MSTLLSTCIVIPTYNERKNLPALVDHIVSLRIPHAQIIVVDDDSPDGTGAIADDLVRTAPLTVVHRERKEGLGRAYIDAFTRLLRGDLGPPPDIILHMDADGSHDPGDIPRLLVALETADIAIGSRYVDGGRIERWGIVRRLVSRVGNSFARRLLHLSVYDCTSGFRAYRRDALAQSIRSAGSVSGYSMLLEMTAAAARLKLRITEIPITFTERTRGQSKFGIRIFGEGVSTLFRLCFTRLFSRIKGV